MRVLVACEFSGRVRDAFAARGHDAWSCDLLPSDAPGPHLQCDVLTVLDRGWDLMIAHPPCTYLCNSGVRWLYGGKGKVRDAKRWSSMEEAARFFKRLADCTVPSVCVENPIMHRYGREIVGRGPTQIVQPWQFGEPESKATGLWLRNLPLLVGTHEVETRRQRVHLESPGPDRWKRRSVTYQGIADAMAAQWGF
jgi:hypothetical protein